MPVKNILVVSSSFYPQISPRSFRTTELVKELAKQGHMVTLYTLKDSTIHEKIAAEWNIVIKDLGKLKLGRINVSHRNKWISLSKRIVNRLFLVLFEYPDIELMFNAAKSIRNENGYDLLISIAVPHPIHWGVARAVKKNKNLTKCWVADCGDPFMGNVLDSFKKLFYFKYIEKWFCRNADYITVPTEQSKAGYFHEFHSKIKVIPQGFNLEDTPVFTGDIQNAIPTFGYAGTFIQGSRDPRELLEFLCAQQSPYKFILYTNDTGLVEPYLHRSGGQVEIRPYVPRPQLIYELSKMNFVVNFTNGTTLVTPSKLIDYAIIKRPVLSIDTGKFNSSVIQQFLNGDYHNRFVVNDAEQYDIKTIAKKFIMLTKA
jgi:hypothetical protein